MEYYESKYTGAEVDALLDKVNKGEASPMGYGEADNSAVLKGEHQGYSNKAISQTSMAVGAGTTAGLKGWYYSAIDFSNKKITLSDKPTYILVGTTLINGGWSSGTPNIVVDDVISLVNDSKYDLCSKVTAISGNVITVDSLPFTELVNDNGAMVAVIAGQFSDGYSVYIPERPDAGLIDFGGGAFSEGGLSKATNIASHAEGLTTHAYGQYSHTEGRETKAGYAAHAEGHLSEATGLRSHAEGYNTKALGNVSHAEGKESKALGIASHAEGYLTEANKEYSHAEGRETKANGGNSHVEGYLSETESLYSHAEGRQTYTAGNNAHAEGWGTVASGNASHAEGNGTQAGKDATRTPTISTSKTEGNFTHAEGTGTKAIGNSSHAEGYFTETSNLGEHACGKYNKSTKSTDAADATMFSIGIGTSDTRKNAVEVKQNGDVYITGVGGYNGTNPNTAKSVQEVINELVNKLNEITTND